MFRSKVISRADIPATVILTKAITDIPIEALTSVYEQFCHFIEQKELLNAAQNINCLLGVGNNNSKEVQDDLRNARSLLNRAYCDLKARVITLCDYLAIANDEHKAMYNVHLTKHVITTHQSTSSPPIKASSPPPKACHPRPQRHVIPACF